MDYTMRGGELPIGNQIIVQYMSRVLPFRFPLHDTLISIARAKNLWQEPMKLSLRRDIIGAMTLADCPKSAHKPKASTLVVGSRDKQHHEVRKKIKEKSMLIGQWIPHILYGLEVILSHWKTNVVLFLCRFIGSFVDWAKIGIELIKTGMGPI